MTDASSPNSSKPHRNWRSAHRARQHDAAHAADAHDDAGHEAPHPLIDSQDELGALIARLRAAGSFAYDTEFIGELTYHPQLCVIQVATTTEIALIDGLAELDLIPFWELLADQSIEKIVHAGEQDMEPVVRHLNRKAQNVIDTQIAAGFVGMAYPVALSKLVKELVGAKLAKGLTFTHWDQRPLSKMQLRYAADDVRYLPALRAELGRRLDAAGHHDFARQESALMCEPARFLFDADADYLRLRGAGTLSPAQLGILRELTSLRDELAQVENVPQRTILRDEVLLDLARKPVKELADLSKVRGLPRPIEEQYGGRIVAATMRAASLPRAELPSMHHHEPSPTERFRADALHAAACVLCSNRGIDPSLVTSRQEIGELTRRLSRGEDILQMRVMTGWRRLVVGDSLTEIYLDRNRLRLDKTAN